MAFAVMISTESSLRTLVYNLLISLLHLRLRGLVIWLHHLHAGHVGEEFSLRKEDHMTIFVSFNVDLRYEGTYDMMW